MSFLISSSSHYIYTISSAINFYFLASFDKNLGANAPENSCFSKIFSYEGAYNQMPMASILEGAGKKKFKGKFLRYHIKTLPSPIPDEEKTSGVPIHFLKKHA